MAITNAV